MTDLDLADIQSNILFRHGRKHTRNLFLSFIPDLENHPTIQNTLRNWLSELKNNNLITSAETAKASYIIRKQQKLETLIENSIHFDNEIKEFGFGSGFLNKGDTIKIDPSNPLLLKFIDTIDERLENTIQNQYDGGTVINIFFSSNAYKKSLRLLNESIDIPKDRSFDLGMTSGIVRESLIDSELQYWGDNYNDECPKIDMLILIADDIEKRIEEQLNEIINSIPSSIYIKKFIEYGKQLKSKQNKYQPIEHFGYADGLNQPNFQKDILGNINEDKAKIVLANDPNGGYGSYLVYRKLEQHVHKLNSVSEEIAAKLSLSKNDIDLDLIGAQFFGRFKNGESLSDTDKPQLKPSKKVRSSVFFTDLDASKCPYHAHIRKINPGKGHTRAPEISRIGIPYGDKIINGHSNFQVGLLFMSIQREISQFETIQKRANNSDLGKKNSGIDPIIGQYIIDKKNEVPPQIWNKGYGINRTDTVSHFTDKLVNLKGGEYLYAPPISFFNKFQKNPII